MDFLLSEANNCGDGIPCSTQVLLQQIILLLLIQRFFTKPDKQTVKEIFFIITVMGQKNDKERAQGANTIKASGFQQNGQCSKAVNAVLLSNSACLLIVDNQKIGKGNNDTRIRNDNHVLSGWYGDIFHLFKIRHNIFIGQQGYRDFVSREIGLKINATHTGNIGCLAYGHIFIQIAFYREILLKLLLYLGSGNMACQDLWNFYGYLLCIHLILPNLTIPQKEVFANPSGLLPIKIHEVYANV
ncbi:hypothetical protein LQZ19_02760 [Treponema primitia]